MPDRFDVVVVGGGIAGATAAAHVAPHRSVALLEQENELAFHTTSRSAAIFLEADGDGVMQRFSTASRSFLEAAHAEIDAPLLTPMPVLTVVTEAGIDGLRESFEATTDRVPSLRLLDRQATVDACPIVNPEVIVASMLEPLAASLDVMALHQLYVRRARASGAEIRRGHRVTALERLANGWRLTTGSGAIDCEVVVNAAGAWGDNVAQMADVEPVGLTPMRRTAFTSPVSSDPSGWPFVYVDDDELHCYLKPEAGQQVLCSLADESPQAAEDVKPHEIDIALALDSLNTVTTLGLRSVSTSWAGLRTFAPDRVPVWGWDPGVDGFFWFVGQGGWGITTSPAAGRMAAAAIVGDGFPNDLTALGVTPEQLAPTRLRVSGP